MTGDLPDRVAAAKHRAEARGFAWSCDDAVGRLLAVLAAAVPPHGTIVELGTGTGVGLAWMIHGLGSRTDVTVLTVDTDAELIDSTSSADWPSTVRFIVDDGARAVAQAAPVDLVFADAPGGKLHGLDQTISSLRACGVLIVDDMDPELHQHDGILDVIDTVRETLLNHRDLIAVELDCSTGVIIATKR